MIICVVMRYGSKRFPGKALVDLGGKNSIEILKGQLSSSKHKMVICCPLGPEGDPIYDFAKTRTNAYRGSLDNVLDRMVSAAEHFKSDSFVRVTGDDLFVDPVYLDILAESHIQSDADLSFSDLPKGTESLVVKTSFGRKILISYGDNTEYWDRKRSNKWDAKINFLPLSPIPANKDTFALELDTYDESITIIDVLEKLEQSGIKQPYHVEDLVKLHKIKPFPNSRDPVDRTYFNNV